jgi:hypothetical protein
MKGKIAVLVVLLSFASLGFAQGFVNLDFESTTLPTNGSPGMVSTAIGIPGWSAYINGVLQSQIDYNDTTLGTSSIGIQGNPNVIQGNFSVTLLAGSTGDCSLSQTGQLPAGAVTLLFDAFATGSGMPNLQVFLNGQSINMQPVMLTPNYPTTTFMGDISIFSGQAVNLTIAAESNYPTGLEYFMLDNVKFSSSPVPEPGELALVAFSALLFGHRRWRSL